LNLQFIVRLSAWRSGLCGMVSCGLAYVAFERAGLPYNEEGDYFDGLVNYHQQSVLAYAVMAFVALLLALGLAWINFKTRRRLISNRE
jgi:hypothetical protein